MTDIKWEEPPAPAANRGAYNEVAAELRANPGRWAVIKESAPGSFAHNIRRGAMAAFRPSSDFEVRGVGVSQDPPRFKVYARFVGEAS